MEETELLQSLLATKVPPATNFARDLQTKNLEGRPHATRRRSTLWPLGRAFPNQYLGGSPTSPTVPNMQRTTANNLSPAPTNRQQPNTPNSGESETPNPASVKQNVVPSCHDAIIFVPGFDSQDTDLSCEDISKLIARAIRGNDPNTTRHVVVDDVREEEYDPDRKLHAQVCTISYTKKSDEVPIKRLDIFRVTYHDLLLKSFNARSFLGKILILILVVLPITLRFILHSHKNGGKSPMEKAQLLIVDFLFFLLAVYASLLIATAVGSVSQAVGIFPTPTPTTALSAATATALAPAAPATTTILAPAAPAAPTTILAPAAPAAPTTALAPAALAATTMMTLTTTTAASGMQDGQRTAKNDFWWKWIFDLRLQQFMLVITALGVLLPNIREPIRQVIQSLGPKIVAMVLYLSYGDRRNVLVGQLRDVLDYVVRKSEESEGLAKYDRIYLVAYSFGTIIALDALMPPQIDQSCAQGDGTSVRFQKISAITTIGSPFDFIRNFWPDYFTHRTDLPQNPYWINIYAPDDIFGSNFRNDSKIGSASKGVSISRHPAKENSAEKTSLKEEESGQNLQDSGSVSSPGETTPPRKPDQNLALVTRIRPKGVSSLFDIFTLMGIRSHKVYWETVDDPQINCFDLWVNALSDTDHQFFPDSQKTDIA